jgi:hypothetical protein
MKLKTTAGGLVLRRLFVSASAKKPDVGYGNIQSWTTMSLSEITEAQRRLCATHGCDFVPVTGDQKAGLAVSTLGMAPLNGLRHPVIGDATGWYIWAGDQWSDSSDFFQPICVDHLIEKLPAVADFLALAPGYRFLLAEGHIDIWFDANLLLV